MTNEGWHPDPFGRHEQRFHDGTRWAAYVRDGDAHAMDDPVPGATMPPPPSHTTTGFEDASRAQRSLLTESRLLVTGTAVLDTSGSRLGEVRTPLPGRVGRRRVERREIVDDVHGMLLSVERRVEAKRGVLVVTDPGGQEIGRVHAQERRAKDEYDVVAASRPVGRLVVERSAGWAATITDIRGREAARLVRDDVGAAGAQVLELTQPIEEPLRSLALASTLAIDLTLKPVGGISLLP